MQDRIKRGANSELTRRLAEVRAELARIEEERNRPSELAAELKELEALGAAAEIKRQAALMHYAARV